MVLFSFLSLEKEGFSCYISSNLNTSVLCKRSMSRTTKTNNDGLASKIVSKYRKRTPSEISGIVLEAVYDRLTGEEKEQLKLEYLRQKLRTIYEGELKNELYYTLVTVNKLSEKEIRAYYLFLKIYIKRAGKNKPFYSLTEIVEEISELAKEMYHLTNRRFLSTTRTELYKTVKKLLPQDKDVQEWFENHGERDNAISFTPEIPGLLIRSFHRFERESHQEVYGGHQPVKLRKKTWNRRTFFPRKDILVGRSPQTTETIIRLLSSIVDLRQNTLEPVFSDLKPDASVEELKTDCRRLLWELELFSQSPEDMLVFFNERELTNYLALRRQNYMENNLRRR